MTEPIKLTLPYPPTANHLFITVMMKNRPVRVPSGEAKKFKKSVGIICQTERIRPLSGEVAIELKVYRPRRVGDIDNTFKATLDALKGYAWNDDAQVVEIHGYRFDDKWKPRVEVEIKEVSAAPELFTEQEPELIY